MNDYNALISAKILDGYEGMLDTVPQPQMLGGKRMRNYVLPASTEYDYPATLAVGTMDGRTPATLGGAFFRDFNQGFPTGVEDLTGGASYIGADGRVHSTPQPAGNPRRIGGKVPKALKSIGKAALPVVKDIGMALAKEGIKEGVKSYAKSGSTSGATSGGRRKRSALKSVGKALSSVGRELAPVAKEVFRDVIVPEGKKALRDYIKSAMKPSSEGEYSGEVAYAEPVGKGRRRKIVGADPRTYTPAHLMAQGGVLIRNGPSQFHSSVYPPALASYDAQMPRGKDAYGRGLPRYSKSPISKPFTAVKKATGGARSARGAIVSEVMKKHGLSLAEASKYVKEKGLY